MKQRIITIICLMLLIGSVSAQSVDQIIDTYLENTGGKKEWRKLQSMKMQGIVPIMGMEMPITVFSKMPNKLKVEVETIFLKVIPQSFDGTTAWAIDPMLGSSYPTKLSAEETQAMYNTTEFAPPYLDYQKKGHEIKLEGKETVNGKECFKLKIIKNKHNDKGEVEEYHYFDTQSYLPVMVSNTGAFGQGKGKFIERFLSNYKKVGKLTIPHLIKVKMDGVTTQEVTFKNISLNEHINDQIFSFPSE